MAKKKGQQKKGGGQPQQQQRKGHQKKGSEQQEQLVPPPDKERQGSFPSLPWWEGVPGCPAFPAVFGKAENSKEHDLQQVRRRSPLRLHTYIRCSGLCVPHVCTAPLLLGTSGFHNRARPHRRLHVYPITLVHCTAA